MNKFDQDELLADVAKSLRDISMSLREFQDGLAIMQRRATMMRTPPATRDLPMARNANFHYWIAGGRPIRDGDSYGIVTRQPPIQQPSPDPEVHANNPTGYLRPINER